MSTDKQKPRPEDGQTAPEDVLTELAPEEDAAKTAPVRDVPAEELLPKVSMGPRRRRRGNGLGIGLVAVALLALVTTLLLLWPDVPDDADATPTPTDAPVLELVAESKATVSSVQLLHSDGHGYIIRYDAGTDSYTLAGQDVLFPADSATLGYAFGSAVSLTNLPLIYEEATNEELTACGLASPTLRWFVNRSDGTSVELALGRANTTGTGYYVRRLGSNAVGLLGNTAATRLFNRQEAYYDFGFLPDSIPPSTEDAPTYSSIAHMLLEQSDRTVELALRTTEELEAAPLGTNEYVMLQPEAYAGMNTSSYGCNTEFLSPITGIAPSTLVEAQPEDLAVYGLDTPVRLTLSDAEGWTGTLLIGGTDAESGGRYVMIEDIDAVLLDSTGDYSFLEIPTYRLRDALLWLYNIENVVQVDFKLDGVHRVLKITKHLTKNEAGEVTATNYSGTFDGVTLTPEDNVKRLYRTALDMTVDAGNESGLPGGDPAYELIITLDSGESHSMCLYRLNELQYAVTVDGVDTLAVLYHSTLKSCVLDRIAVIDAGGELSMQ